MGLAEQCDLEQLSRGTLTCSQIPGVHVPAPDPGPQTQNSKLPVRSENDRTAPLHTSKQKSGSFNRGGGFLKPVPAS